MSVIMFNRRRVASWLVYGIGGPVLLLGSLYSFFGNAREKARRSSCGSNLKQIGLGLAQYRHDFDEKLPPTTLNAAPFSHPIANASWPENRPAFGWGDGIQPYLKSVCIYQCPSETNAPNYPADVAGYMDYWFNANLAMGKTRDASLIMLGDGFGRSTARYAVSGLPANWSDSPSEKSSWSGTQKPWFERHLGGANYAFADGHVKWLRPEDAAAPEKWKPAG